jgi:ABC-type transporter Mla maintaining outer membrane lipid asymmetry ATPase subunit MlaF
VARAGPARSARRAKRLRIRKTGMASVDVRKVDKFFGSTQILHGVSVDIPDGEFVVLVGPRAAGSRRCSG